MRHAFPGLAVIAGRARGHERVHDAGGQRLRQFRRLDGDRLRADKFGDARGADIVGAPLQALHVVKGVDVFLGINALRTPRHREEEHQALRRELLFDGRFRGEPQLPGCRIARRQERNNIDAEHRIFVLMPRDQNLTRLRLSGGDRALDFRRLEQRCGGMHGNLQLAAGGVADVLGERDQVHRMRIVRRIGRRQIPFGLRHYGSGKRRDGDGHRARVNNPEHDNTFL